MIALWILVVAYMFWGLAHVCEEFLVPSLNVLCERCRIPDDVAGATLMAAGCNGPIVFASIIGVFLDHSTVGAGTVVGSAPFNLMCICGAASLAVGGKVHLDGWLMGREILFLSLSLVLLLCVLDDGKVLWWEALLLVLLYVLYTVACVYTSSVVALLYRLTRRSQPSLAASDAAASLELGSTAAADGQASGTGALLGPSGSLRDSLARSLAHSLLELDDGPGSLHARVPERTHHADGAGQPPRTALAAADGAGDADDHADDAQWDMLVADCRKRIAGYRVQSVSAACNGGGGGGSGSGGGGGSGGRGASGGRRPLCEGILLKKSRFYSGLRIGRKIWQRRYFELDADPSQPFRYMRIVDDNVLPLEARGVTPIRAHHVVIDLYKVCDIERTSDRELQLVTTQRTHRLRCLPDDSSAVIQRWFDELVCALDGIRKSGRGAPPIDLEFDEGQDPWWRLPTGPVWIAVHLATFPLKGLIHLTCPEIHRRGCERYYPLALCMAVVWLALLAYVMTLALERIGCAMGVPSTVIGLTLGAIGTSFPNLYASILTAQAGQAGMSICQAFGSNTFNICIGLGLVWLLEALAGECTFGAWGTLNGASCDGCYMPVGFVSACPHLPGFKPPPVSGSLNGTALVVFLNILLLLVTFVLASCGIPKHAAYVFFLVYAMYLFYEVCGNYGWLPPICIGEVCL